MTRRRRIGAFVAITTATIAVVIAYVVVAAIHAGDPGAAGGGSGAVATRLARGDLLLLDRDRAHAKAWGRLVVVAPGGRRTLGRLTCERVAFAGGRGICLAQAGAFPAPTYEARFFDAAQRVTGRVKLQGTPSRARVSPDGRYAASTTFVSGDAYTTPGAFSTRTRIYDARRGVVVADLEDFTVVRGGRRFDRPDFNFWGVTFVGGTGAFYATLASGTSHYLVRGDVATRRLTVVRDGVECPSLSPDGRRLAFKVRVGDPWRWRFHVLDLATGRETALAETRSVDDQIAWLDDRRLAYGVDEQVFTAPADGSGAPRRLRAGATNPGVVG